VRVAPRGNTLTLIARIRLSAKASPLYSRLCNVIETRLVLYAPLYFERPFGLTWMKAFKTKYILGIITVGINPILSDFKGPGTSKLDWRYLEHNKIDRNKLQIRTN
jgi:hypothetical protein